MRFVEVVVSCPKSWSLAAELHPDISAAYDAAQDSAAQQIIGWLGGGRLEDNFVAIALRQRSFVTVLTVEGASTRKSSAVALSVEGKIVLERQSRRGK